MGGRAEVWAGADFIWSKNALPIGVDEVLQDQGRNPDVLVLALLDQKIGLMGQEIAFVLIDLDPKREDVAIGFGMELGGVDMPPIAYHLKRAGA